MCDAMPECGRDRLGLSRGYLAGRLHDAVDTARLKGFIYVLRCFQKKSKAGIKTPKRDLELIRRRLAEAELHFRAVAERKG
jgi:hypothetical protein